MAFIRKNGKYVRNIDFIKDFDLANLVIYENITKEQAEKLGLKNIGDVIIPSSEFGTYCRKNVFGYSYANKTKPKEWRIVTTFYMHPYGNDEADEILVDIPRYCYPRVDVSPNEIEIALQESKGELLAIIVTNNQVKTKYLKEAINIMLEVFGGCNISDEGINIPAIKRSRVNWVMLPPGTKPSTYFEKRLQGDNEHKCRFILDRLKTLEKYDVDEIVSGINSFQGYVAYMIKDYCVLESAVYGNATYILKRDNWEEQSKKSKGVLLSENNVVAKIEHTKNWEAKLGDKTRLLGIK